MPAARAMLLVERSSTPSLAIKDSVVSSMCSTVASARLRFGVRRIGEADFGSEFEAETLFTDPV